MKILVISTSFPLTLGDSLSPFMWEYCRRLKNMGWGVAVIVPHHRGIRIRDSWEGIEIRRFRYLPEKFETLAYSGGLLPGVKKNPLIALLLPMFIGSMYKEAIAALRREQFDIVNIHWLFPAAFWAARLHKKTGSRIVFTGHGTDIRISRKFPFTQFAESALKISSGLTVNSEYMKSLLKGFSIPANSVVIPMGVDTEKFNPGDKSCCDSRKVLFIGRLIRQKGADILLKAFALLTESYPDAELEIIGHGPEKERLIEISGRLNIGGKVIFSESVPHGELPAKYREARLLASPSLIGEGFGMTVAEAASCGVPSVTFGLGGTSELVRGGATGLIVEPNAEALANGFKKLFSENDLTRLLGENARNRIWENYSWDIISRKFDRYFRDLISAAK
jgi:glycogen(starch) synthase